MQPTLLSHSRFMRAEPGLPECQCTYHLDSIIFRLIMLFIPQHTFADFSRILSNATYFDGNASEYDWVLNQGQIINTNQSGGELAMILTETNGGTRLSSTRYVHYGKITTRRKFSAIFVCSVWRLQTNRFMLSVLRK